MRRKKQEIVDRQQIEEILKRERVGRLATIGSDGYPYIVPLNFVYTNSSIYFHSARAGEKLGNIGRDSRVCFEVDTVLSYIDQGFDPKMAPCDVGQFYQSVIVRGRAELVIDPEEKLLALNGLMACHEGVEEYDRIVAGMKGVELCHVVAVRIERVSAKQNLGLHKGEEAGQRFRSYLAERDLPVDRKCVEIMDSLSARNQ